MFRQLTGLVKRRASPASSVNYGLDTFLPYSSGKDVTEHALWLPALLVMYTHLESFTGVVCLCWTTCENL